jgi:alpha-1,2-glucosyltransferase
LWRLALVACTAAALVPTPLLELRYFIVPALLVTLRECESSTATVRANIALFAAVNAAAVYIFVFRPFQWPDGSVARFMY